MSDPLFIDSPVNVLRGDAARVALSSTNDAAYKDRHGHGVLSVPLERWQQAQEYERATWLKYGLTLTEDRNTEHAAHFDGYKSLPNDLGNVIELGCGPFTNLIHILPGRWSKTVTLLDPLLRDYLRHPHCSYPDTVLLGNRVKWSDSTIEKYRSDPWSYDTVVMINVLSHCFNVGRVFGWINTHLKQGGTLVFHEPARDIDIHSHWDIGHPLSYTQAVIDEFLAGYTEVYRKGDYFIGVKK